MSDDINVEKAQCAYKNKDGKCDWWFGDAHTHQHIIDSCDTEGHCMVDCDEDLLKDCSYCWMVILHGYEWSNRTKSCCPECADETRARKDATLYECERNDEH